MIHFHYCFFIIIIRPRHRSTLFPYTTLFRSARRAYEKGEKMGGAYHVLAWIVTWPMLAVCLHESDLDRAIELARALVAPDVQPAAEPVREALGEAVAAADAGDRARAYSRLREAAERAREPGYL